MLPAGEQKKYTFIPGPVREMVTRNGRDSVEYRDRDTVTITLHPTPVPDDVADMLVKHRDYGRAFVEVTGVDEQIAAIESGQIQAKPERKKRAEKPQADSEITPVDYVNTAPEAIMFLTQNGASAEEMMDKAGRPNFARIKEAAKKLGYVFPNYGS